MACTHTSKPGPCVSCELDAGAPIAVTKCPAIDGAEQFFVPVRGSRAPAIDAFAGSNEKNAKTPDRRYAVGAGKLPLDGNLPTRACGARSSCECFDAAEAIRRLGISEKEFLRRVRYREITGHGGRYTQAALDASRAWLDGITPEQHTAYRAAIDASKSHASADGGEAVWVTARAGLQAARAARIEKSELESWETARAEIRAELDPEDVKKRRSESARRAWASRNKNKVDAVGEALVRRAEPVIEATVEVVEVVAEPVIEATVEVVAEPVIEPMPKRLSRSEVMKTYLASLTPEQREERTRSRLEAAKTRIANMTPEQRSEIARRAAATRIANMTPEQRSEVGRRLGARVSREALSAAAKARMARLTPEERSEIGRRMGKARMTRITPEQRAELTRARWHREESEGQPATTSPESQQQ